MEASNNDSNKRRVTCLGLRRAVSSIIILVEAHCHVVDKDKLILSRYVAEPIESDTVSQ